MKKGNEHFFTKYWRWIVFLAACFILFFKIWEYPFEDSLFIAINIVFLAYVVLKINEKGLKADALVALFIGILALQAAWPIFMPRISLEDINQEVGIINADKKQYQMVREAIVRIKPPLFPNPLIMNRDYPIANNLTKIYYDQSSPNLDISDSGDRRSVNIKLNHVSGWSFDEISGRIKYLADKPFRILLSIQLGNQNISNIDKIPKLQDYELYPYNYRYSFYVENENNFPIEIYNLSFSIYNDTSAWKYLKKWTDEGFCVFPIYQWNYSLSGPMVEVNGERTIISGKMFSSSTMSLQIPYIPLAPHETKNPNIVFKEIVCGDTVKDKPSYTSYNITGTVTSYKVTPYREDANYFIILIRNINTAKLGSTYAFPNTPYKYDLASLPDGYTQRDIVQINVCENFQNCTASKNITVDMAKGYSEVNFP